MYIGTHGTGLKHGNMATFVTKLELVSGKGEVKSGNNYIHTSYVRILKYKNDF